MTELLILILALILLALLCLRLWRQADTMAERREWQNLSYLQPSRPDRFDLEMIAALPEPAKRFFSYAIAPDTPLTIVAEVSMRGRFALGDAAAPRYIDMEAEQILAAPRGFLWKMKGRGANLRISGSDTSTWTRFWLFGVLPVVRIGGTTDHARAAFGREIAEAVFWTPAAVLPCAEVAWKPVDDDTARVVVRYRGLEQEVDLTVDSDGRPQMVSFQRWSNANPDKQFRFQPFGGYLSEFKEFGGFRLPTHVEAGNFFGTDAYFPFFIADVTSVRYPTTAD